MEPDDTVLVVLLNCPRDLEILQSEHWYRVPARRAPAHSIHARFLAFYLTGAFGDNRWSIREYAPVRGHEMVRRGDLFPDEADHPRVDEPYLKFQLGPLIQLPRPIVSPRGRRILFVWTTGERFSRAVEIDDLLGKSAADDLLWDALKTAGIRAERQVAVRDRRGRYRVDYWIPCEQGHLAIQLSGSLPLPKNRKWRALEISEDEISAKLDQCIERISRMIREMGNAKYTSEQPHEHSH